MKKKQREDNGPKVNCAFDTVAPTEKQKPNPRNPNKHPDGQLRIYAKVLRHQGWRKAIVVSNQSGCIVTGEGAWRTAVAEGWTAVPIDYQDFTSPEQELQHLLADNSLPQLAETDEQELSAILAEDLAGLDAELAGALEEVPPDTELKPVEVRRPPRMAWVLIGIPLVRFSEINEDVEKIAGLADTIVETSIADGEQPPKSKT